MSNVLLNTETNLEFDLPENTTVNTGSLSSFIESVKRANKLPINIGEIYYSDDIWDFSPYVVLNIGKHSLRISFSNVEQPFKDELKNYTLIKILENREKIQTIRGRVLELRKFFNYMSSKHVFNIDEITLEMIKSYLSLRRKEKNELGIFEIKQTLKSFYMAYSANFHDILTDKHLNLFSERNVKLLNALRHQNKTPDIPQGYFDRFLSTCIQMMNNETLHVDYRAIACLLIMASQTGIRINELLNLSVNALKTITIFNGEESNYLTYNTWKRENGNNVSSTETTYINPVAKAAFTTLRELHKEKRARLKQNFLYMGSSNRDTEDEFPLDYDKFMRDEQKFYIQMNVFFPTLNLAKEDYPELTTKKSTFKVDFTGTLTEKIRTITCPSHIQFRVHCCTELYRQGVPLQYIQRFMGHLSHEMKGYYVRPKDEKQENAEFSNAILKDIVSGNAKLIGGDKGLQEKINQFIDENGFSVEKDIDTICDRLSEKIPIRQKTGGVCIKSSQLRDCSIDAKTNDFYCAYGVCPNIFHFYYMIDISYRKAKELEESINLNIERGHTKQAQKELNMLKTIATQQLTPEIEELKKTIEKRGLSQVYMDHPEVQPIVENLDSIEKEITVWTIPKTSNES